MFNLFHSVLDLLLPFAGTLGVGFLVWVLKKKFNLQITAEQERLLAHLMHRALAYAEEWAHKQKQLPDAPPVTGEAKLEKAVAFAKAELKRTKIKLSDDDVDALLHSSLGVLRGDG